MATLHVRNIPDPLYQQIQALALAENRSLSAQVTILLQRAIQEDDKQRQHLDALASIRRRRFVPPPGSPTSLDLLREDRDR